MKLADIVNAGRPQLDAKYGRKLTPNQHKALNAISACASGDYGQLQWQCGSCEQQTSTARSCGHRSCPRCQNAVVSDWLERQQAKLLPVTYFMVTFTVPKELRGLIYRHQDTAYDALMRAAASTLKSFAETKLKAKTGACLVLHTHSRRLDFHPHIHAVIPGGGVTAARQWRKLQGNYLYPAKALAKVFRARLLEALIDEGITIPPNLTKQWVVDVTKVGNGLSALTYLARYLYRGVISERNIIAFNQTDGTVTFAYTHSASGEPKTRTLPVEDFLWRLMLHVLPCGFRRVRDYGLLHGNAKRLRTLVQLVLYVRLPPTPTRPTRTVTCSRCQCAMRLLGFVRVRWQSN